MTSSKINRRQFLKLNSAALAGTLAVPGIFSKTKADTDGRGDPVADNSSPGFYRFSFGEMEITVVNDGYFDFPFNLIPIDDPMDFLAYNADPETRKEYFHSRRLSNNRVPLRLSPILIDSGRERTLIDTGFGAGEGAPPTSGHLIPSLIAAGIEPGSIDNVLLTHAHPDHLGGVLDPSDGSPLYPEAEVVIGEKERAFWMGDDVADDDPLVDVARTVLEGADNRLRTAEGETEVADGIWSIPSYGHTPGHICYAVESNGLQLLITGDAICYTHISFEHPEWQVFVDTDREEAVSTRKRLLDRATTDEMFMLGFHFPFPGLGYAVRYGDAYRWQQAVTAR